MKKRFVHIPADSVELEGTLEILETAEDVALFSMGAEVAPTIHQTSL